MPDLVIKCLYVYVLWFTRTNPSVCGIKSRNKIFFLLVLIDLVVPLRRERIVLKFNSSKTYGKD